MRISRSSVNWSYEAVEAYDETVRTSIGLRRYACRRRMQFFCLVLIHLMMTMMTYRMIRRPT